MAEILLGNVKGPQGNTGATGSQGPQGDPATITVGTVSTTAYGNPASVTNSGTEQDAVLDFVIPQGKPGEQTTRMGALTLDTITAQSADFPIPVVGETGSTVFGKIIKFFNSTISALNSKLNISDVVNNLTSTSTTQPLSAAQGKALNDALADKVKIQYFNPSYNMGTLSANSGNTIRINFGKTLPNWYVPVIWNTQGNSTINNVHWAITARDTTGLSLYLWNSGSATSATIIYGIAVLSPDAAS